MPSATNATARTIVPRAIGPRMRGWPQPTEKIGSPPVQPLRQLQRRRLVESIGCIAIPGDVCRATVSVSHHASLSGGSTRTSSRWVMVIRPSESGGGVQGAPNAIDELFEPTSHVLALAREGHRVCLRLISTNRTRLLCQLHVDLLISRVLLQLFGGLARLA